MVENKRSCPPEEIESNKSTEKNKGQEPKSKKYKGNNTQTKYQGTEPKDETNFKGCYSDL